MRDDLFRRRIAIVMHANVNQPTEFMLDQVVRERDPERYNPDPFCTHAKLESLTWEAKACQRADTVRRFSHKKARTA